MYSFFWICSLFYALYFSWINFCEFCYFREINSLQKLYLGLTDQNESFLLNELWNCKIHVFYVILFVLFNSRRTPHKQCLCQFQFPSNYPEGAMLIELKSKVFSDKVLKTMTQLLETELKKMTGRVQVFLCSIIWIFRCLVKKMKIFLSQILISFWNYKLFIKKCFFV